MEEQYLNCIRCGLCLAVCPTYRESLSEIDSPRGRVALARKGLEGGLELSRNLYEQMNACFDCMACDEICPVGIRPAELTLAMRDLDEQKRRRPWKKTLFERLLPYPGRLEWTTWPLRLYESLGLRKLVQTLGLQKALPKQMKDLEVQLPPLPRRPLRSTLPEVTAASGEAKRVVGFFLGCAQSLLFAEESAATVRVLARNGCTVVTPRETVCCGMPARGFGKIEQVLGQARKNIGVFEEAGVETIITDCATCGSMLKEYGELLSDDPEWAERAKVFSEKVRDISEYLIGLPLEKPQGRIDARVTYHDPCHLRRGQGVWREPRRLLQMIEGIKFIELPEADWCCGSAGSQLITHYETSLGVLKRKTGHLAETEAEYVASGCPGCQMQLRVGIRREGLKMKVIHPIELLDRAYEAGRKEDGEDIQR